MTSPFPVGPEEAPERTRQLLASHPHMRFVDMVHKGYVLLDADAERLQAEFWHVGTIERRDPAESLAAAFVTARGANHLETVGSATAPGEMRDPAP